jgi:hypothetical protein
MVEAADPPTKKSEALPKAIELSMTESPSEGHKCPYCSLIFTSEKDLCTHKAGKERLISCTHCSIKFLTFKGMKQHFGKKHTKSRPYRCKICYKRFRNVYAARIHKQQVHMNSSRLLCAHCGKSLYNKYSLSRHRLVCRVVQSRQKNEDISDNMEDWH